MSKREVNLPAAPPFVDPRLSNNPQAMKYAQAAAERAKYKEPVAGGPNPPIPPLNQNFQAGMTMADQAAQSMFQAGQSAQGPAMQGGMFVPHPAGSPLLHKTQSPTMGILPQDILPEAAKSDPEFQGGMGSMHASAQPLLAQKYGVIRNGQHIPPQQLHTGRPGLKKETLEGLNMLQELQNKASTVEADRAQHEAEQQAASGVAGSAARIGNQPGDDSIKPVTDADREKMQRAIEKMDDFDLNTFREIMMKDILNNEDQRKAIEARLEPMDLTDIIMTGRVKQRVPIIPGKYEPVFQSMSGEEDLALKRLIWQEQKSLNAPNQYLLDKYSLMGVALSVVSINHTLFPEYRDNSGNFDDELFIKKFNYVVKLPFHMLSSLGINFFWFDVRVRKLFQADAVKNG